MARARLRTLFQGARTRYDMEVLMCCSCNASSLNRREFMGAVAFGVAGAAMAGGAASKAPITTDWDPKKTMIRTGHPLTIQPVLLVSLPKRREQTSWRSWGGLQNEDDVAVEVKRIRAELDNMKKKADFKLAIKPVIRVRNPEEAQKIRDAKDYDVPIVYAASGWTTALEACFSANRNNLIFLRHKSGPIYLWYEIVHNRFLRQGNATQDLDEYRYPSGMTIDDVVVDNYDEMLCKLRGLYGVHNFIGRRIVALGGSSGWCNPKAPDIAREKFNLDIVHVDYADLEKRLITARADKARVKRTQKWARQYLSLPETTLHTDEQFVINAFLLYDVFKKYLTEYEAAAFTIQACMGTVLSLIHI